MTEVKIIGIVGGGQLGRMLTQAAKPLGFDVVVLDSAENGPAVQAGAKLLNGGLKDSDAIAHLGEMCDVVTIEIEHIDVEALEVIETAGTPVHPSPTTIRMIQDKFKQKEFLQEHGIAVAESVEITDNESAFTALESFGGQMLLKTRHGAYDGRGNAKVTSPEELNAALLLFTDQKLYAERLVPFTKELAVMVARDIHGAIKTYPVTETIHERNICIETLSPAPIDTKIHKHATELATKTGELLQGAGVFGIEMFLTADGTILVNEIAPRVHNSGHYTMDACKTSQFEQHIRAITGMELGSVEMITPASSMINILGERAGPVDIQGLDEVTSMPQTFVHLYGKSPTKIDRKMGHVNVIGETLEQTTAIAIKARSRFSI